MSMKMDIAKMQESVAEAEELLKALANRHRLAILGQLVNGEHSVSELADALEIRDANVSQHLMLLRKDKLVTTRREGQTIWYSVSSEAARRLVGTLNQVFRTSSRVHVITDGSPHK